jgi:hypothetical protein
MEARKVRRPRTSERGQASLEYVLTASAVILPLTFAIIFTAQLLWVWHSVVEYTREGGRYATTHCWQGDGENVATYMKTHVPLMVDLDQFQNGEAQIELKYFSRDAESGQLVDFSCDGGDCSTMCVPDAVSVRITNYEFRKFVSYLGLPAVKIPDFYTILPMESAGCDPEQGSCLP